MRFVAAVLALSLAGCPLAAATPAKPNILLVTVDTLRADHLGCYGDANIRTPAIDALAARGVLFTRAFAHTPSTLPSHTNILLGLTPNAHGIHDNSNFIVRDDFLTLAEWLKGRGYQTGAFVGAFPLDSRFGLTQGFDVYDDNYGSQGPTDMVFIERKADVVVGKALEWLKGRTGPWFLWVHLFDPHQPYEPPDPFRSQYPDQPYDGEIAYTDASLAKLFAYLKDGGLEGRTAVVFTADHGESLGEHGESTHGYFAYNATLHVPLILAFPGVKPGRVEANSSHVDIFPTLCGLVGEKEPPGLQGRSLLPLIRGRNLPEKPIYFEALTAYYNRSWAPLRGFIRGPDKFMETPIPEVYDLANDFAEVNNLAGRVDLAPFRKAFAELVRAESSPLAEKAGQAMDRTTAEKLRSLGYLASPQKPTKKDFTAQDDLKTLYPYHNKWQKATAAYHAGRPEEGIALLREIIAERKDFHLAYTYLANFLQEQKRPAEAEAVLREALKNNPDSFRIMTALGIIMIDNRRYDEAIDLLQKSLTAIDFDPETWNYLGVAYWNTGRFDEASQAYERALSLDGNYAIVFNNRGSLRLSLFLKEQKPEELRQALEDFRKAVELDPKYASAWNGLGVGLRQSGEVDGAIEAWKKAVELKPDFGFALFNLGLALLGRGDRTEAL
ncbi:MAG TPA: sulfatase-like hydrolase/transferase, partial [Acidobacteriota bacterium]|nr:sulfatase-like hydrolase/transferase [Acidobacteriota bacterium]